MELLEAILGAKNGGAVEQIARSLGVDRGDTENVIRQLAPALGRGLQKNAGDQPGLESLLNALRTGNHQRYLDNPELSVQDDGISEGNKILGHILGSKDVSRRLASHASEQTGVSDGLIKKMLPMIATVAMGALSNRAQAGQSGEALGGLIGAFLGGGKSGSIVDDLVGMAGKFLGR